VLLKDFLCVNATTRHRGWYREGRRKGGKEKGKEGRRNGEGRSNIESIRVKMGKRGRNGGRSQKRKRGIA
jgi:hypothetical protein